MEQTHIAQDFLRERVAKDTKEGIFDARVATRFPPEPNGYLHIGHAKSICINFGIAEEFNGTCNMRFDDTNPVKEDTEYVESIMEDVKWLGFNWSGSEKYASDYFEELYGLAVKLIKMDKAYVCELSAEEIRATRGTLTEPGKESPYRNRPIEESLNLFERMRKGEFEDGKYILRAKIDMASPNISMRDPAIYRIRHAHHHRTGDKWCVYPMYDFTHCLSDSIEKVTHSICTLEFENNRELYEWVLNTLDVYRSQQIEFARLQLSYTVLSKRKLIQLVKENYVSGWDDPRMPTICGFRRKGYTPESIRNFCARIGVGRVPDSVVEFSQLEACVREHLNEVTPRLMAVLDPIKVTITNYPEEQVEYFDAPLHPEEASYGSRQVPFSRTLYIEKDDFRLEAPKKYFRLALGQEVRLRYAYYITCTDVIKDENGEVVEILCTYDPETKGGTSPDGRKVKGTIHWVSANEAKEIDVNLYEQLFSVENPNSLPEGQTFLDLLNPNSLTQIKAFAEPHLLTYKPYDRVQFERLAYFCVDKESEAGKPVYNRIVTLKDSWAKIEKKA